MTESMALAQPAPVAVLLHLANTRYWPEFRLALQQITAPFDLYINLVSGLNSEQSIARQQQQILRDYPASHIIISSNRGMDVGGMFRLFAQVVDKPYQVLFYAHSKSDPHWRQALLGKLSQHSAAAIQSLSNSENRTGMIGAYLYPFDYYNLGPFLDIMARLNIKLESDWTRYFERFPGMRDVALEQRIAHIQDVGMPQLRPNIDLEYAQTLLGNPDLPGQRMNAGWQKQFIKDGVISGLPYFPGNFFWIRMSIIRQLSQLIDFDAEWAALPLDLSSDQQIQSRAHAWERALPVFAAKKGWRLEAGGWRLET